MPLRNPINLFAIITLALAGFFAGGWFQAHLDLKRPTVVNETKIGKIKRPASVELSNDTEVSSTYAPQEAENPLRKKRNIFKIFKKKIPSP